MEFARVNYTMELANEILPLNLAHDAEVSCFPDIPLNPDYAQYQVCQNSGMLRVYTARELGVLVGYSLYFVRSAPHYRGSIQAAQDILFLTPSVRKGHNGARFIKWCDSQLKLEGVQVVYMSVTHRGTNFGDVLKHMGYISIETMYAKRLDTWEAD